MVQLQMNRFADVEHTCRAVLPYLERDEEWVRKQPLIYKHLAEALRKRWQLREALRYFVLWRRHEPRNPFLNTFGMRMMMGILDWGFFLGGMTMKPINVDDDRLAADMETKDIFGRGRKKA
jgi:hypothetical protein